MLTSLTRSILAKDGFLPTGEVRGRNSRALLKLNRHSRDEGWVWCLLLSRRKDGQEVILAVGRTDRCLSARMEEIENSLSASRGLGAELYRARFRGDRVEIWARRADLGLSLGRPVRLAHQEKAYWVDRLKPTYGI